MNTFVIERSIFARYPLVAVAALAAESGFGLPQTHQLIEVWEAMQRADDQYRFWLKTKEQEDLDQYKADFTEALGLLPPFRFNSAVIASPRYLISAQADVLINILKQTCAPRPALIPQEASDDLFNQFDDIDIAYAAAVANLDVSDSVDGWEAIRAAEETREALEDNAFASDLEEVQYKDDVWDVLGILAGLHIPLSNTDNPTPREIAVDFLRHLRLIA